MDEMSMEERFGAVGARFEWWLFEVHGLRTNELEPKTVMEYFTIFIRQIRNKED